MEKFCKMCGVSSSDRADWDEYSGLCPGCSYDEHVMEDAAAWQAAFTAAMRTMVSVIMEDMMTYRVSILRELIELLPRVHKHEGELDDHERALVLASLAAARAVLNRGPAALVRHEAARVTRAADRFA